MILHLLFTDILDSEARRLPTHTCITASQDDVNRPQYCRSIWLKGSEKIRADSAENLTEQDEMALIITRVK